MRIGIFQGRLTDSKRLQNFPVNWRREFFIKNIFGLTHVELFLETKKNNKNPFWSKKGQKQIKNLIEKYSEKKIIICDNLIIKKKLFSKKTQNYLLDIIKRLKIFEKSKLILPLNSEYFKDTKKLSNYFDGILRFKSDNMTISFEVDSNPEKVLNFIKNLNHSNIGVTFDIGNVFLKNKNFLKYFKKLKKYINHVHLKDRNGKGENVRLGTGIIKIDLFLKFLNKINFKKEITLETFRKNNSILECYYNLNYLKKFLKI